MRGRRVDVVIIALQDKADSAGILVVSSSTVGNDTHRLLNPEEFRGFVMVDDYAPLIFINSADSKAAQMFTFAHELAHLWLGSSSAFDLRELQPADERTEQVCNRIAAEFLVPSENFTKLWRRHGGSRDILQVMARSFKVSKIVAARRALDLGFMNREDFSEFYRTHQERGRERTSRRHGGNFYATQMQKLGRSFAMAVIHAVLEGDLLYREAYRLTGLYGKTFDCFLQRALSGRI
ncbi:MAG TPA: ImmA/IrrE family metallo-endopeptidase [Candidatus Hydrogenedentes bacterium]|mgnify:CR=1 FL=1|nr:ImmA/IrrE family metallo-endopeptidase [Candidatus Hydrogenedentota bacterium]